MEKLIIAVSVAKKNNTFTQVVEKWIDLAQRGDYKALVIDSTEKTHTEKYIVKKKYRWSYPIISRFGRPKDLNRFIIQAYSCINHDSYEELNKINSPTLVIGGAKDYVVGRNTSEEMAEKIRDSELVIYDDLGHGAYIESKDFSSRVLSFLRK